MIFLSYWGITRYITLYFQSTESFINNYRKLSPYNNKNISIIMSTEPEKISKLKPVINSILDQTVKVTKITLTLPQRNLDQTNLIPEYMKKVISIYDIGKNNKNWCSDVLPILLCEKEVDTTIIILKDNIIYGKDFIEKLLTASDANPTTVISTDKNDAILLKPEHYNYDSICKNNGTCDEKWLLNNAKKVKSINYMENYKMISPPPPFKAPIL